MLTPLADGYRRHRFAWLFGSLILTITVSPALHAIVPRVNAVELLLAINLVAIVSTVGRQHGMGWMLWIGEPSWPCAPGRRRADCPRSSRSPEPRYAALEGAMMQALGATK
jgi:hypothetical protein